LERIAERGLFISITINCFVKKIYATVVLALRAQKTLSLDGRLRALDVDSVNSSNDYFV
jgi:hypothetical protein